MTLTLYDQAKRPEIEEQQFYVGFRGSFGDNYVNPRTLRAAFLGKMVCLEGIVTKCKYKFDLICECGILEFLAGDGSKGVVCLIYIFIYIY